MIEYQIKWAYSDLKENEQPQDPNHFYIHFEFYLKFPQIPPGRGHTAHFCFNVLSPSMAKQEAVSLTESRTYKILESFSYAQIIQSVEQEVEKAFLGNSLEQAIDALNLLYVYTDLDFSKEFNADVQSLDATLSLIEEAFEGVTREEGITLHEAVVIDNYGTEEEQAQARNLDCETRWQDVPDADIADYPSYLTFLDSAGFRYYIPANMRWALKNYHNDRWDCAFFTYLKFFPVIAPRDVGRGLGKKFNVEEFTAKHSFTLKQVKAIYSFLCFMAIEAKLEIQEDFYPAMLEWRRLSFQSVS